MARWEAGAQSDRLASIPRDLDWIVMKCLEKYRTRRFDTAQGLALDIQRYLSEEPVSARPQSTLYRVHKLWKRNKALVVAGTMIFAALVIGLVMSLWQARVAAIARERALDAESIERQRLYAAEMNPLQQALNNGDLGRARELLYRHVPREGQADLRDWEWRYHWQLCQTDEISTLCEGELPTGTGLLPVARIRPCDCGTPAAGRKRSLFRVTRTRCGL